MAFPTHLFSFQKGWGAVVIIHFCEQSHAYSCLLWPAQG